VFSRAKQFIKRAGELINRPNHFKPWPHRVIFSADVENTFKSKNEVILIFPIPPNSDYQLLENLPDYNPKDCHIGFDDKFGNSYVYWRSSIPSHAARSFALSFVAAVSPRRQAIDPAWRLKNYDYIKKTKNYSLYIKSNRYLNGVDRRIKIMADETVQGNDNLAKVALDLYEFTLRFLNYANPIAGLYSLDEVLEKRNVDCGGFASLLGSLYISMGIPARVISGFWADSLQNGAEASQKMHAWLEILLPNGQWFPVDPSIGYLKRLDRTSRYGGFGFVGSDRIVFSFGEDIPLKAVDEDLVVDILQNPVVIAQGGKDSVKTHIEIFTEEMKNNQ